MADLIKHSTAVTRNIRRTYDRVAALRGLTRGFMRLNTYYSESLRYLPT